MTRQTEDFDLEIPSFMQTREYDQKRREHLIRVEEERQRILKESEQRRRYKLQKQAQEKRMREIRRIKGAIVKIVLCGMTVVVVGSGLVAGLNGFKSEAEEIREPYVISVAQEENEPQYEIKNANDYEVEVSSMPEVPKINIDLSYEARNASIDTSGTFAVGSEVNSYLLDVLNASEAYPLFLKYGEMYGVDPYILIAKAFQESSLKHNSCLPGGANYNGYGVGIMQHESPDGREIVAHNYQTGEDDVMYLTMENAIDLEKNIRMGAMSTQKCIENNNGNMLISLQTYNYGDYMMHSILTNYAEVCNKTVDAVKNSFSDSGWLSLVQDAHENPNNYISGWRGKYGDSNYIKNVLRYFIGDTTYYYYNGVKYIFNLNTFETLEVTENVNIIK